MFHRSVSLVWAVVAIAALSCSREPDSSQQSAHTAGPAGESPGHLISRAEIEVLENQGLASPVQQLVSSLLANAEVIPHDGVLGGIMGFYTDESICILNAQTVFARFADGHIEGSGTFAFTIQPDGSIAWTVLSSRIEGSPIEDTSN